MGGGAMGGGGGGGGGLPSAGNAPAEQAASGAQGVPIVPGGDVSAMSGFQGPGGTTFPSGINFATSGLGDTPVDTSGLGGSTWSTAGMWGNQTAGGDLALATGATTPGFAGPGGTNFTYGSDPFAAIAGVSPYGYGMGGSSWDATLGNIPDQFNFPSSQSLGTPNYPYLGGG